MSSKKTFEEKIEEIEKKISDLKEQKKVLQSEHTKEQRAKRTRRLIENGALAEKYLNCEKIEPKDFEKILLEICKCNEVKEIINRATL